MAVRCGVGVEAWNLDQQIKLLSWNYGQLYIAELSNDSFFRAFKLW